MAKSGLVSVSVVVVVGVVVVVVAVVVVRGKMKRTTACTINKN